MQVKLQPSPASPPSSLAPLASAPCRPYVGGKFLFRGNQKLHLRGVTYGPFRPEADGSEYHQRSDVARDFACMAASGINAVRTYTVPPRWLLDVAQEHGLLVMVGMPWEQHITFLDDSERVQAIEERVREGVRACAGHPAVLCYTIGNEIPAPLVRWYGGRRIERFLKRLYRAAKAEDPAGLVTYVNYPTTEYLQLPFLDFACFNVYLEKKETLDAYLARLQNIAGDRPLVMAEIGLDSQRNGVETQAEVLDWQVRSAFAAGAAGIFVFAWTDEWHRGGNDIDDWDFGITTRNRQPKPALAAVATAFAETPFPDALAWPRISVVVCTYNGAATLRDCCSGLTQLEYPNFEVIVVDDGSTDLSAAIAEEFNFRVIRTPNQGLSAARNTGLAAATGEIVAYTDDDAHPDPHWLTYLAATFMSTDFAAVGGPNIPPPDDGFVATCVANAPGGPLHVLISDTEAEHIPGCNMAFRKERLEAIGGFDQRFHTAGDDVDVCWRLRQQGWTIGFSAAAMVWHHRRNSVAGYWRQQRGYGGAEALLEMKWPAKYNALGHVLWSGQIYGPGQTVALVSQRWRIYYGVWGSRPFQLLYQRTPGALAALPMMPDWYLAIGGLAILTLLGLLWAPLLWALPLLGVAILIPLVQALLSARTATSPARSVTRGIRFKQYALTVGLHLLQPAARLWGRLRHGLTPWRRARRGGVRFSTAAHSAAVV